MQLHFALDGKAEFASQPASTVAPELEDPALLLLWPRDFGSLHVGPVPGF
jgi:hypothetical protein